MRVELIAMTRWTPEALSTIEEETGWTPTGADSDGEEIVELAGRECYQSWDKPNPKTATSPDYLANLLLQEHESVLEHVNFTVRIIGVSRSLTHELVRHRHFSYSQLSQRYVEAPLEEIVVPPLYAGDDVALAILTKMQETIAWAYKELAQHGEDMLTLAGVEGVAKRKKAREAARCVLPNMTPTNIVVTGNWRAWRWFFLKRNHPAADAEIQELAATIREMIGQAGGFTALDGTQKPES